jgi:hypothetical protein
MVIRGDDVPRRFQPPNGPVDVPPSVRPRQSGLHDCLSCLGVFVLLVAVVMGVVFFTALRHFPVARRSEDPAGLRQVVGTRAVGRAAQAAARRDTDLMDAVSTAAHGDPVGQDAVSDACRSQGDVNVDAGRFPVACIRASFRVLGAHGGPRATVLAMDRALRARGWYDPDAADPRQPLKLPPDGVPFEIPYTDGAAQELSIEWSAPSTAGLPRGSAATQPPPAPSFGYPPAPGSPGVRTTVEGPSADRIASAYAHYPFLVAIRMSDSYWHGISNHS